MLKDLLDLKIELNEALEGINAQIDEVGVVARDMGVSIHKVKNVQGEGLLVNLLVAKAMLLNALASLEMMTKEQ